MMKSDNIEGSTRGMSEENKWGTGLPDEDKICFGRTETADASLFCRTENAGERLRKWNKRQQFSE